MMLPYPYGKKSGSTKTGLEVSRDSLTPAEWSVVSRLRTSTRTVEGVAYEMGVNESTVRKHLENAYRKLGVNSREQMVKAIDESLLPKNRIQVFGVYL